MDNNNHQVEGNDIDDVHQVLASLEWYYDVTGDMIYHQVHQIIIELMEKLNERDAK
jgi:hypothetical protein